MSAKLAEELRAINRNIHDTRRRLADLRRQRRVILRRQELQADAALSDVIDEIAADVFDSQCPRRFDEAFGM